MLISTHIDTEVFVNRLCGDAHTHGINKAAFLFCVLFETIRCVNAKLYISQNSTAILCFVSYALLLGLF